MSYSQTVYLGYCIKVKSEDFNFFRDILDNEENEELQEQLEDFYCTAGNDEGQNIILLNYKDENKEEGNKDWELPYREHLEHQIRVDSIPVPKMEYWKLISKALRDRNIDFEFIYGLVVYWM